MKNRKRLFPAFTIIYFDEVKKKLFYSPDNIHRELKRA